MKTIDKFLFIPFIVLLMLMASCSESDGAGEEVVSESLSFAPSFLELADNATDATIDLQWEKTEWSISLGEGEVVKSVAPLSGGRANYASSTTLKLELNPNTGSEPRAQDVLAIDSKGAVKRLVLTQQAYSQWTRVEVDPSTHYQPVVGFGGMYNPYIWTPSNLVSNSEIDKLYGSSGLGYNVMRLMIYSDKNAWSKDVSGAQRAKNRGAVIFACPWDCKDEWAETVTVGSSQKRHLRPEYYADYANHLCDYITFMKGKGITLYGITVQNEPDGSFVYWTSEELASFIKTYGDKIRATGVKLMSPEPEGVNLNYMTPIVTDAETMAHVDVVATHTYTGFIDDKDNGPTKRNFLANLYLNQLQPEGKSWWMTEHLFNDGSTSSFPEERLFQQWSYNLTHLALEIHYCMTGYASAYVYWYIKRYYGLIGDNDELSPVASGEVTKNGYILSHYAAYAANSVRIKAECEHSDLTVTAYTVSTTESSVILTNYSEESIPVKLTGLQASRAKAVTTTESANMEETAVRMETGDACLTLPPMSITSVKCYTY